MALLKKPAEKKDKELEKLPLKKLERSMPQEEEEKAEKEKGGSSRKGKF